MTRVAVDGTGYTAASAALGDANRFAAVAADTLGTALAGGAAMAGDSSFASEFAASYDEGAAAIVGALDDVVDGLASLCRITYCSYENHARAEQSSIASTVVVSTEPSMQSQDLYAGASPTPPASLGGDASFVPGWATVILDHVEGFLWPDADVDRLRATAAAWREAAGRTDHLVDLAGTAIDELLHERSPEILLATGAIARLRGGIREVGDACHQLGQACDDYATAVETQRELILDLVSDLIRDAVLIQAAGFVLGLVTGGSANAVAMWINSGKLAAQAPRFKAFVDAVRTAGAGVAVSMRAGTAVVVRVRVELARFVKARRLQMGERGAADLGSNKVVTFLGKHEGGPAKAHTLRKHVGKSDRYLQRRLRRFPDLSEVSTYTDEAIAERSILRVIAHYGDDMKSWLTGAGSHQFARNLDLGTPVGRIMTADGVTRPGQIVRLVLRKDPEMPDGYRIITSYIVG